MAVEPDLRTIPSWSIDLQKPFKTVILQWPLPGPWGLRTEEQSENLDTPQLDPGASAVEEKVWRGVSRLLEFGVVCVILSDFRREEIRRGWGDRLPETLKNNLLVDRTGALWAIQRNLLAKRGIGPKESVFVATRSYGVPPEMPRFIGAPSEITSFLEYQAQLHFLRSRDLSVHLDRSVFEQYLTRDHVWVVEQEGFDASQEREMESIFSIGNGYMGVRGSMSLLIPLSQPGLLIAGIYDRKITALPYSEVSFLDRSGHENSFREIVSFPFPFRFSIRVAGHQLNVVDGTTLQDYHRILDLRNGILFERFLFQDPEGRKTRLRTTRCASLSDRHLLLQEIEVFCENHASTIEIDASTEEPDLELQYPHLRPQTMPVGSTNGRISEVRGYRTIVSGYEVFLASRLSFNGRETGGVKWAGNAIGKEPVRIRRMTGVYTSRDGDEACSSMLQDLSSKEWSEFFDRIDQHVGEWKRFWDVADIEYDGNQALTESQRFNSYHLRIAADNDSKVSVAARGLCGRAYEGHVFWDSEIFVLPFFCNNSPDIARSLLLYRYQTLDGARRRAREMGYRGACYAWESTVTGDDVTPLKILLKGTGQEIPIFTGQQQIHVTADVAYGIWRYWEWTQDRDFMARAGCEILFETARFWVSRVTGGAGDPAGEFHILRVIGPDEYHHDVNDNAFTNWMARVNLEKAAWAAEWMRVEAPDEWRELAARIALRDDEIREWKNVASRLFFPKPDRNGVIEQFTGFFDLKDAAVHEEETLKAPLNRLLFWRDVNQERLIKQADVLMIPFLFPDAWPEKMIRANYEYYRRVTDHGSSLSPCVHGAIAARIGELEDARRFFELALNLDLLNRMQNTSLGIHVGCMGGTWQTLLFHILDLGPRQDNRAEMAEIPLFDCDGIRLKLNYRGVIRRYHLKKRMSA